MFAAYRTNKDLVSTIKNLYRTSMKRQPNRNMDKKTGRDISQKWKYQDLFKNTGKDDESHQ